MTRMMRIVVTIITTAADNDGNKSDGNSKSINHDGNDVRDDGNGMITITEIHNFNLAIMKIIAK